MCFLGFQDLTETMKSVKETLKEDIVNQLLTHQLPEVKKRFSDLELAQHVLHVHTVVLPSLEAADKVLARLQQMHKVMTMK